MTISCFCVPSVLFALLVMLLINACSILDHSLDILIPRYLAESVIGKGR